MKKYKLIRDYPGSPSMGSIAVVMENSYSIEDKEKNVFHCSVGKDEKKKMFEDFPQFWQEIIPEYCILSFISISSGVIYSLQKSGKYYAHGTLMEKEVEGEGFLKEPNRYQIHSVKRLSDGAIFTIGEKVEIIGGAGNKFIISGFKIKESEMTMCFNDRLDFCIVLDKVYYKKEIFTTYDGVKIYEKDNFYIVQDYYYGKNLGLGKHDSGGDKYKFIANVFTPKQTERTIYFSTRELAEEYILLNQPCLSINDIILSEDGLVRLESKLKEIVKSKSKQ